MDNGILSQLLGYGQSPTAQAITPGAYQGAMQATGNPVDINALSLFGQGAPDLTGDVSPWSMKGIFGGTLGDGSQINGWGGAALGTGSALMNGYLGMQQYGLAKQQLAESQRQFDKQYAAQKTLTNSQLSDRQRARVASNPNAYQSVSDYMQRNGV